ncbi:MAG: response regulator [Myxococcales bacterium]|nr:response regulator [Myxococcales bacterium]
MTPNVGMDIDEPHPVVHGDARLLLQVFTGVLGRAARVMPPLGQIRIACHPVDFEPTDPLIGEGLMPGPHVRVRIEDEGEPMSEELLDRLFDPFSDFGGRGTRDSLDLAAAFGLIRAHGGHMRGQRRPLGGTSIDVYLPTGPSESHTPLPTSSDQTILVVDDEASLREIMQRTLQQHGYRVLCTASGFGALETCRDTAVSLVILDLVMPGMGGMELLEALLARHPSLPVVVVSGDADPAQIAELHKQGAKAFLPKPHRRAELLELVARLVGDST